MKINREVYSLSKGYSPIVYKGENGLTYSFPVSSAHVELTFEFEISEQDLDILKSSQLRFKALYFILFHEAQSTFGIGHPNPRKYTLEEFEETKNKILYQSEDKISLYIKEFSIDRNFAENYFQSFSKNVFGEE